MMRGGSWCPISWRIWWRIFAVLSAVCFALLLVTPATAQTFDATSLREPAAMEKTWLVHAGDDPAYARPDFDDSHWIPFDDKQSLHDVLRGPRPEVVWYRLHLKVLPRQYGLALGEFYLSDAFAFYVNGNKLMESGQVAPHVPYTSFANLIARIPDAEIATGSVVIALRTHISVAEWSNRYPGLYYTNLVLGQEHEMHEHNALTTIGQHASTWVNELFGMGLGLVALALFLAQRQRKEYLWLFLFAFSNFLALLWAVLELTHNFPLIWELADLPLLLGFMIFLILLYYTFLGLRIGRWMWICIAFASLVIAANLILKSVFGRTTEAYDLVAQIPLQVLIGGVLPVLTVVQWRKGNREAGILLIPLLSLSLSLYVRVTLLGLSLIPSLYDKANAISKGIFAMPVGAFTLGLVDLDILLFNLSLTIVIVLRATQASRQQALLEGELAAAREVQQVILPEKGEAIPGFKVESVYLPALQVGGDFFQVLPAEEGGMLLAIGDVAGKGLPAAMLVSVLVGAVRAAAEYTEVPAELLANLNERLIGRVHGGFSTALIAHFSADRTVIIANAGHLSPYLDGKEVTLPGALPLGIASGVRYESTQFLLEPGSRLTFYSDGVVEAQDAHGALFGFERAQALSTQSAQTIVDAAKHFGQQDDITVITIERATASPMTAADEVLSGRSMQ
jgi:sigma-B regulation protein RsbU (phosphoserine phosphatase)